jgi:hypothetical protein
MRWWKCPSTALKLAKLSPRRSRQWSCVRTLIAGFRAGRMRSQCCWQFQWHPFPICEPVSKNFEPVSLGAAQKNGKSPRAPEIRRATGLLRRWIDGASRHRNKDKSLIMRLLSAPDVETVSSADWVVVQVVSGEPVSAAINGNLMGIRLKNGGRGNLHPKTNGSSRHALVPLRSRIVCVAVDGSSGKPLSLLVRGLSTNGCSWLFTRRRGSGHERQHHLWRLPNGDFLKVIPGKFRSLPVFTSYTMT